MTEKSKSHVAKPHRDPPIIEFNKICEQTDSCGPFIVGITKCRLCGALEKGVMVVPDSDVFDFEVECGSCGQMCAQLLDIREVEP